jgi:hypothetical protein
MNKFERLEYDIDNTLEDTQREITRLVERFMRNNTNGPDNSTLVYSGYICDLTLEKLKSDIPTHLHDIEIYVKRRS